MSLTVCKEIKCTADAVTGFDCDVRECTVNWRSHYIIYMPEVPNTGRRQKIFEGLRRTLVIVHHTMYHGTLSVVVRRRWHQLELLFD